jgi:hypothetical protein
MESESVQSGNEKPLVDLSKEPVAYVTPDSALSIVEEALRALSVQERVAQNVTRPQQRSRAMARLQLDLSDTSTALLDKLAVLCDLKTKKDIVENALILLAWAASEASRGLSIAAVDEERRIYKEVRTQALEGARQKAERERTPSHPLSARS